MFLAQVIILGAIVEGSFAASSTLCTSTSTQNAAASAASELVAASACSDSDLLNDFQSLPEATNFCSTLLSIVPTTITSTMTMIVLPTTITATEIADTDTEAQFISRRTTTLTDTVTSTRTATMLLDVRSTNGLPTAPPTKRMVTVALSLNIFEDGPTATAPPMSLMPSLSSLCNCLSLPTPSVTTTVTMRQPASVITVFSLAPVTVTSTSTALATTTSYPMPEQCNNAGIQFGGFKYPFGNGPPYTIDPQFVRDKRAAENFLGSGVTTVPLGWSFLTDPCPADSPGLPYGPVNRSCAAYTYDHRGYFFAPISGNYTFTLRFVDDIALLWLGDIAYRNFGRPNATLEAQVRNTNGTSSFSMQLGAGSYTPVRLMMSNVGGPTHGSFDIVAPGGVRVLDSKITRAGNPYLVQFGCNRNAEALPFTNQVNGVY